MKTIPSIKEIRIWTECYRPFMMGGDVNRPISTKVTATGPWDLGKGFKGYVVMSPNGTQFVAESISGGLVGPTLDKVREDIASADVKMMKKQVKEAKKRGEYAEHFSIIEFWKMMHSAI